MKVLRIAALALAAAALSCSTLEITTDYDPARDFSGYRTFTLKHGSASKSSIAVERFESALAAALESRGLERAPEGGDLTLYAHFVLGKETRIDTYGYGGWYGWGWGGGTSTTTVQQIPTGTVVVDLVDARTNKAVWRGIAKDQISTSATPEERQQKAADVAAQLFARFPPAPKK